MSIGDAHNGAAAAKGEEDVHTARKGRYEIDVGAGRIETGDDGDDGRGVGRDSSNAEVVVAVELVLVDEQNSCTTFGRRGW